jgi:hypothetical protein
MRVAIRVIIGAALSRSTACANAAPCAGFADSERFGHYVFGVGAHFTAGERGGPYAAIHRQGRTYNFSLVTPPGTAGDVEFLPPVGKLYYEDAACGTGGRIWMRFEEAPFSPPSTSIRKRSA